jgi:hypothetical protein
MGGHLVVDFTTATFCLVCFCLQLIRTNNDAEEWHNKINLKGKMEGIHFYQLVPLLLRESYFVEVEALF